jgi:hypothetical protein
MTNAELAILSLLAEQPRHGYEIEQVIEQRGMREWTEIGFSSIYYLLKKLEGRQLVEGRPDADSARGPARLVYFITPAGLKACQTATYEALSIPQPVHSAFLMGLANLPMLPPEQAHQALSEYRHRLAKHRDHVRGRWAQERTTAPDHVQALFDLSVTLIEAQLQWIDRYIEKEEAQMAQQTLDPKLFYTARKDPELYEVPAGQFLTVSGQGAPDSEAFQQAVGALYSVAYTLKFKLKPLGLEFKVPALEGLWWVSDPTNWMNAPRETWQWKLLIRMPDFVTEEQFVQARDEAQAKKKAPAIGGVRFEPFAEGLAAQVMHIGPYSEERPTIDRLHAFIAEQGCVPVGHHHEIYLGDPQRSAPEKLKTILRQPVAKA